MPGDFMRDSAKRDQPRFQENRQPPAGDDAGGTFWQWLAIGVLIGCWLAEATWCIDRGF